MKREVNVKVIKVVQVGNRRFSTAKAAATEYALHGCTRLWNKYRTRFVHNSAEEGKFYWALRDRMIRRTIPIFLRILP